MEEQMKTTIGDDVEVVVSFDFEPAELGYGNHPDIPDRVWINEITDGTKAWPKDMFVSEKDILLLEDECLDYAKRLRQQERDAFLEDYYGYC